MKPVSKIYMLQRLSHVMLFGLKLLALKIRLVLI